MHIKSLIRYLTPVLAVTFLGVAIAGCSKKASMTNKQLTSEYTKNTEAALIARGTVAKQVSNKSKKDDAKYLKLTAKSKKVLNEEKALVNKSYKKVSASNNGAGKYPSELANYQKQILNYISVLQNGGTVKQAKSEFHKITTKGQEINIKYQGMKQNRFLNIATFSDEASGYKSQSPLSITPTDKKQKNSPEKAPLNQQNKKSSVRKLSKKDLINETAITPGWGIWLIIVCVVIIASVFLQPNRSNDAMNALTESGGATLFDRPKPKGYELFLMRTTEVGTIVLIISLVIFNIRNLH